MTKKTDSEEDSFFYDGFKLFNKDSKFTEEDKKELFNILNYDYWQIYHLPGKFITYEICLMAVSRNYLPNINKVVDVGIGSVDFEFVPEKFKTAELCLAAIRSGGSLEYVPEELKTEELCRIAVEKRRDLNLKYVPEELYGKII